MNALFGVSLAIIGTMVTALGNHLVFKSHTIKKNDPKLSNLYFYFGNFSIIVIGTSFGIAALGYAPQSLIAPIGGLTIIWNLLFAILPFFGGIKPNRLEIIATFLTLFGIFIIIYLGPQNRFRKNTFWLFFKPSFLTLVISYFFLGFFLETYKFTNRMQIRIASGAVGGVVGGISNVFAKSAIDFYTGNQVPTESEDYLSFILVTLIALGLAGSQISFFNHALASYSVVQIVPVYQTSLILSATISGGIAFDEFEGFSLLHSLGFISGVLLSIFGVAFLASSSNSILDNDVKD